MDCCKSCTMLFHLFIVWNNCLLTLVCTLVYGGGPLSSIEMSLALCDSRKDYCVREWDTFCELTRLCTRFSDALISSISALSCWLNFCSSTMNSGILSSACTG